MKLWKSKKSPQNGGTTGCSGKLHLSSKSSQQNSYQDDKIETSSATSTATQSTSQLMASTNGLSQGT